MSVQVFQPFEIFYDINGKPLDDGFIWVGQPNLDPETNQVSVFFDEALTIPAAQPIRTRNGFPSNSGIQSSLFVSSIAFSVKIENKNGTLISQNTISNTRSVNIWNYAALVTDKPTPGNPDTWNWTPAFKAMSEDFTDNSHYEIPAGIYNVSVTDSDLTDIGFNRDFALMLITGKTNVSIGGPGRIIFKCSSATKRAEFLVFKNCAAPNVDGLNLEGELNPQENVPNSETGIGSGVMFFNCTDFRLVRSNLKKLIIPYWVTGQPVSPATAAQVSSRGVIAGNNFDTYEQNSTFGAGAQDLLVYGNTHIDQYCALKISQNPLNDVSAQGQSRGVIFANNTVRWRPTFQFAQVWFQPANCESPYGIQIQAATQDILIVDNIIDQSACRAFTLPPITEPAPVAAFTQVAGAGGVDAFQTARVTLRGNTLIGNPNNGFWAANMAANVRDLDVADNTLIGGVIVSASSATGFQYGLLRIAQNKVRNNGTVRAAFISVGANGNFDTIDISDNDLHGSSGVTVSGDQELIFVHSFTTTDLVVKNNKLRNGKIGNYGSPRLTTAKLEIIGNICKGIDLATTDLIKASILSNSVLTDGTAYKLDLDAISKANCRVKFAGNSCAGLTVDNSGVALNLNGGNLRLDANSLAATSGTAFAFDSTVVIFSGEYYGNGAPTQSALFGTTYVDYAAGSNGKYLKTTPSGTSGWFRVDTFISGTATVDIPSIAASGTHAFDITVTGAVFGNTALATGGNGTGAALMWSAQVSAADTVKVTLFNPTGAPIDPTSQTITARVFK